MRRIGPLVFALFVLALEPFAEHALQELSNGKDPLPCTCIGPANARLNVVYLHGLDTFGPSWTEIRNRQKLRAISELLQARIALPRTRHSWLPHRQLEDTVQQITLAAGTCFPKSPRFVLLGFSDGANATTQAFLACRTDLTSRFVSVGSGGGEGTKSATLRDCGEIDLIAGRHEPGLNATKLLVRQLSKRGAHVRFYEHGGPHELPFAETLLALGGLDR